MARPTFRATMQQADEANLDPSQAYDASSAPPRLDTINRPQAVPAEEDGVVHELNGRPQQGDLGAFAKLQQLAKQPRGITSAGAAGTGPAEQHNSNMAAAVDETVLQDLGRDLLSEIEEAERSREPWKELAERGFKELGFDRSSEQRSFPFKGASAVVHPSFAKAVVAMAARTTAQLAPPEGPAACEVVGKSTPELEDRAARVGRFLNWQCKKQISEWKPETDRLMMMVAVEGSSFKKAWYEPNEKRPKVAYIPAEQIIMPYSASCEMTSPLVAEELWPLKHEVESKIASGFWSEHDIGEPQQRMNSDLRRAMDSVVGLDETSGQDNSRYGGLQYFECSITRVIEELDPQPREWLVTVARHREMVVSVRRNWRASDPLMRRRRMLQHYKLFPWRGAYGLGLFHMIGGLGLSATGSLRALLDSAMIQNMGGGFRLSTSRTSGGTIEKAPGDFVDVEAPPGVRDIREVIMPDETTTPSNVLLELLGIVSQAADEFAGVALQDVAEKDSETPVGTELARIDEGSRVYSGIFGRLHHAQGLELQTIYDIDMETLAEQAAVHVFDEPEITLEDFKSTLNITPVSDPRNYSQMQRVLKSQTRLQLAKEAKLDGVQVDMRAAYLEAAKSMQLASPDQLFPQPPEPFSGDPWTENNAALKGTPLTTQMLQPHEEHLIIHLSLLLLPGMITSPAGQALFPHYVEHCAHGATVISTTGQMDAGEWYAGWMERLAPALMPPGDPAIEKMAEAERLKVEQKREESKIDVQAKAIITDKETESKEKIVAAQLAADLQKIEASKDAKEADAILQTTITREKNASEERKTAAKLMADAQKPPPAPRPPPPGAKKKPARPS